MTKTRDLADFVSAGNPLADGTIDVADINGVTATTAEINTLDGVVATTAELNILSGLTATTSELNNVTGVNSDVQTQLDGKVDLAGDTMTGALILSADPTVALGAATKQYVDTSVSNLVDAAPATLDTLNELAAALGDDANFSTTVTNSIATKVAKAGDTMTGNLSFGDNDKAIFGAGSDLQIYHNGSDSYIDEAGTGNLYIRANASTYIMDKNTSEVCANFASNGAVTLYYDNAAKLATTATGVTVTGTVAATAFSGDGSALTGIEGVPSGVIAMWSGSIASIPTGWVLCDGNNSTPDLRDRFVVGAGSTYAVADTGGSNTVTLTESQMPGHTHTISGNTSTTGAHTHTLSGNTSNSGNHTHNGSTSNVGNHTHNVGFSFNNDERNGGGNGGVPNSGTSATSAAGSHSHNFTTAAGGDHSHTLSGNAASAGDHSHTLSATAASTGGGSAHENRPPYYALAYIMKT